MAKAILVVDDEKKMREFISFFLIKEGYSVMETSNGLDAISKMRNETVQLIILDLMMPGMNGFSVCQEIRKFSDVPIIMLTAVEGEQEHLDGYASGVDDYITKPFKIKILLAKINRILGKCENGFLQIAQLKIHRQKREVKVEDTQVTLAPKEYELLDYLIQNRNIALHRNQILEQVWDYDFDGGIRVVDNHIKKLRSKLGVFGNNIKTVMGYGYKLEVQK